MKPALVIARREFLERVRSKWFVIVTILGPIMMIALIVVPAVLARSGGEKAKVEIVDHGSGLGPGLVAAFTAVEWEAKIVPADTPEQTLLDHIRDKQSNGFLDVPADATTGGKLVYQGDNASSTAVLVKMNQVVNATIYASRATTAGVSPEQLGTILGKVELDLILSTGEKGGKSGFASFAVGYILMFILYIAILLYGVAVMRSVVQEKTSRVIELMVAAAKPRDLMAGKILGVGAVGLLQLGTWLLMALLALTYRETILGWFGVTGGPDLPALTLDQIAVAIAYFLGGYFFYASLYAAVGAMVSSDQEAQQAQAPVMMLVIIPMVCMQLVANDPRGGVAQAMTMIPFSSAILMPMRYVLGGATGAEVVISLAILTVSTYLVIRAAAKIYRVGILLYGKRPSLRELWRWLRY